MSTVDGRPSTSEASRKRRAVLLGWSALIVSLIALLSVLAVVEHEDVHRLPGRVTRIIDADTIEVRLATGSMRVRLYAIDAPELDQPWGPEATQALSKMILGKKVELEPFEQDRYDRLVATVFVGKVDVNADLVRLGPYGHFVPQMTTADAQLCDLEGPGTSSAAWPVVPGASTR